MKLIQVAVFLHIRHFLEEVNSFSLRSINFLLTDILFLSPVLQGVKFYLSLYSFPLFKTLLEEPEGPLTT